MRKPFVAALLLLSSWSCSAITTNVHKELEGLLELEGVSAVAISLRFSQGLPPFDLALGTYERGGDRPITPSSLFQIGSVTKNFIASLVLQLQSEGLIALDAPLSAYLQTPWGEVRIKELLNMTSGIFDYIQDGALRREWSLNPLKRWTDAELVAFAATHPPLFPPGSRYDYSNTNYILLGMIIEKVTGNPLNEELTRRLFEPLGLHDTYYLDAPLDRMVHGYSIPGGPLVPPVPPNIDVTRFDLSIAGPAGGMISTAHDLAKWTESLFTGKVLDLKALKEMERVNCLKEFCFGLGIAALPPDAADSPAWFFGGETGGYVAMIAYLPRRGIAASLCLNSTPPRMSVLRRLLQAANDLYPVDTD